MNLIKQNKLQMDLDFLRTIYTIDPELLDEMALPSLFHKNPLIRWITSTRLKKTLSLLEIKKETRLLDFGCGPGILLLQLPKDQGDFYGVDLELWPVKKMMEHSRRIDIKFLHANDWMDIISDDYLDFIIATEVLEHIKDVNSIIRNFKQKLKIGGRLIVSLPTENLIYRLGRKIAGFSGNYHQDEIVDIKKICNSEGFNLNLKISIPIAGPFCMYQLYDFSKL